MMTLNGFRLAVALTLALSFPIASCAADQDQPSKQSETAPSLKVPDIGGAGTLDYSYDIDVPDYHGIEPKLTLNYSSTRKTKTGGLYQGWLGYGWGFKGFDVIERARHKGTIPNLDKYDVFLLNGEELIPCTADSDPDTVETVAGVNSSASCKAGGTHVSETENYLKIVANGANPHFPNSWTITNREGTKMVLQPVRAFVNNPPDTTLANSTRYLVSSITDTNGNQVTYNYDCPQIPVCYPKSITYNGGGLAFYYEARPDDIVAANGQNLSIVDQRLSAIKVRVGTDVVAAYKLDYEVAAAPGSGASRLVKISRYGTNAQVSDTGAVTLPNGGLGPKATTFKYADYAGFGVAKNIDGINRVEGSLPFDNASDGTKGLLPADVDSDGIMEFLANRGNDTVCYRLISFLNSSTTDYNQLNVPVKCATAVYAPSSISGAPSVKLPEFSLGHFAGDITKTQMLFRHYNGPSNPTDTIDPVVDTEAIFNRQDNGTFSVDIHTCANGNVTADQPRKQCGKDHPKTQVVDFDGNGRDDLQTTQDDNMPGGIGVVNLFDDGKQQQVFVRAAGLKAKRVLPGASHTGPEMTTLKAGLSCPGGPLGQSELDYSQCEFADLNGDGLDDLVIVSTHHDMENLHDNTCPDSLATPCKYFVSLNVYLSLGRDDDANLKWVYGETLSSGRAAKVTGATLRLQDLDSDGKAEIIVDNVIAMSDADHDQENRQHTFSIRRLRLNADGSYVLPTISTFVTRELVLGDVNGDGLVDYLSRDALRLHGYANSPFISPSDSKYNYIQWGDPYFDLVAYRNDIQEASQNTPAQLTRASASSSTALPNLLTQVTTEMGAISTFEYKPSTAFKNTYLPFPVAAVTKVTVDDGRGNAAVTRYDYSLGLYNVVNRKFLGFKTATKTLPKLAGETGNPTVVTTYRQDVASYGLPEKVRYYDATGTLKKVEDEGYSVNAAAPPYRAQSISSVTTFNEGSVTRKLKSERDWDIYGNIVDERQLRLIASDGTNITGDDSHTTHEFTYNTGKYIVSLPFREKTYKGAASTDPADVLARTDFWYGNTNLSDQPISTNVSQRMIYRGDGTSVTTTFQYDDVGNKTVEQTATDENSSNRTEWDYTDNQHLLPTQMRRKVSGTTYLTTNYVNDPLCQAVVTETDPNAVATQHTYDDFCRETEVKNTTTGAKVSTTYVGDDNLGSLRSGTSLGSAPRIIVNTPLPGGAQTQTIKYYDGFGRTYLTRTDGDTSSPTGFLQTVYDDRGNVWKQSLPFADDTPGDITDNTPKWTVNNYDWANRVILTTNPDGTTRKQDYQLSSTYTSDKTDNFVIGQTVLTDELKRLTETSYSSDGDVVMTRRSPDGSTAFILLQSASYDRLRRLVEVQDAGGAVWTYTYDWAGNRTKAVDPDMGTWTYTYDLANRLITQTDARNKVTTITYDQLDRVLTKRTGVSNYFVNNTYDEGGAAAFAKGQLTTATNGLDVSDPDYAQQKFSYDANGLVTKKVVKIAYAANTYLTHTEETTYHDASRLVIYKKYYRDASTALLAVGDNTNRWTYNAKGQLTTIPGYITATSYELDGQTDNITYANNVRTNFAYGTYRRWLTRLTTTNTATNTVLIDNSYVRDDIGHITSITGLDWYNRWDYAYDARDRLTTATINSNAANAMSETFSYTLNGNMTNRTRGGTLTYGGQVVNDSGQTLSRTLPHAIATFAGFTHTYDENGNTRKDDKRDFGWDPANRLQKVTVRATSAATKFVYGPDGERVKKVSPSGLVTLYPDANVEITQIDASTWQYTRYPHMDVKVEGNTKYFLHRDHLATVKQVTTSAGDIMENNFYAAYGEMVKRSNNPGDPITAAPPTKKAYIGERFDFETGLSYLHARYLDSVSGHMLSPDDLSPVLPGVGTNRYTYSENDPINKADNNGHQSAVDTNGNSTGFSDEPPPDGDFGWFGKGGWSKDVSDFVHDIKENTVKKAARDIYGHLKGFGEDPWGEIEGIPENPASGVVVGTKVTIVAGLKLGATIIGITKRVGKVTSYLKPDTIRFTQDSIKGLFKDGRTVKQMAADLASGKLKAKDVPPLSVFMKDGKIYSLDNRRLAAFKDAGVDVPVNWASPDEVAKQAWKFTTQNDGISIVIRGEK